MKNKKADSGWVRLLIYKKVILLTLYGNEKDHNRLKIKCSDYVFAIIDKSIRDIVAKKPNEMFILEFKK